MPQAKLKPKLAVQFQNRLHGNQIEQLWQLYQSEWWSRGRKLEEVRRAVEHSDLLFAFRDPASDSVVAFARVLTDFVYKAVIFDVIVESSHREHGLGRRLLDAIVSTPALLFVEHIELYCLPELVPFYEKWGFTGDLGELRFLRKAS